MKFIGIGVHVTWLKPKYVLFWTMFVFLLSIVHINIHRASNSGYKCLQIPLSLESSKSQHVIPTTVWLYMWMSVIKSRTMSSKDIKDKLVDGPPNHWAKRFLRLSDHLCDHMHNITELAPTLASPSRLIVYFFNNSCYFYSLKVIHFLCGQVKLSCWIHWTFLSFAEFHRDFYLVYICKMYSSQSIPVYRCTCAGCFGQKSMKIPSTLSKWRG